MNKKVKFKVSSYGALEQGVIFTISPNIEFLQILEAYSLCKPWINTFQRHREINKELVIEQFIFNPSFPNEFTYRRAYEKSFNGYMQIFPL